MFKTSYPNDRGQAFYGGQYGIPIITERDDKSRLPEWLAAERRVLLRGERSLVSPRTWVYPS